MSAGERLLTVENLETTIPSRSGHVRPVSGASFHIDAGETVALVGESGCGKSMTALSLMRLLPHPGEITGGSIWFKGDNLVNASTRDMRRMRGMELAMVFQDPMTFLNPLMTVGQQIAETIRLHHQVGSYEAMRQSVLALERVRMPAPDRAAASYPHQISGGMRQRVIIAIAIACQPSLLIADEPTTALDVTIQAQIMDLLHDLKQERGLSLLLITHDLGLVAEQSDRVYVMYAGQIVEHGTTEDIFEAPAHPYTEFLLASARSIVSGTNFPDVSGGPPDLRSPPPGCRFHPRCPYVMEVCSTDQPELFTNGDTHSRCWLRRDWSTQAAEVPR